MKEGWVRIRIIDTLRMTKYHYFRDKASLCGKYIFFGSSEILNDCRAPLDSCKTCLRLLGKEDE